MKLIDSFTHSQGALSHQSKDTYTWLAQEKWSDKLFVESGD